MGQKKSWKEIVKEYPDKWVALSDCSMEGIRIIKAVVVAICSDQERLGTEKQLVEKNIRFVWRRTTDIEGAFVL